jgi:hypothetical protein
MQAVEYGHGCEDDGVRGGRAGSIRGTVYALNTHSQEYLELDQGTTRRASLAQSNSREENS